MSQTVTRIPVRKARTWRRRFLLTLMFLVVLGVGGILGFLWFSSYDLNALMAEMDVQDPGWRLHDIEASRKAVPDAGNSALHIVAVGKLRAGQTVITPPMEKVFENLPPEVQLSEQQRDHLEKRFAILLAAVVEARKLKDMPLGRHPIKYSDDGLSTLVPHLTDAWEVCALLQWDAARRAHATDNEGALESCLALQNAARSMGDEPFFISLMVRVGCNGFAVRAIERTLAQSHVTPASEPTLKLMQEVFAEELTEPTLLIALRGQRAGLHQFVQAMVEGKVTAATLGAVGRTVDILEAVYQGNRGKRSLNNEVESRLTEYLPGSLTRQHAAMLHFANDMVDAGRLPPEQAEERFEALEKKIRNETYLVRITAPSLIKIREAERRLRANIRCAVAALAAERYRLAHNRWPESLDDLVKAGFLDAVPIDPYDGKPIRLKRVADGLVLYSVGPDKIDNDGFMNRDNPADPGTDIGFRLWDISARRQAPNPPVKKEKPAK
jgi:hypothetical protein